MLTEILFQRENCARNCDGQMAKKAGMLVGKIYSRISQCQPNIQIIKLANMADGQLHMAVYGNVFFLICKYDLQLPFFY